MRITPLSERSLSILLDHYPEQRWWMFLEKYFTSGWSHAQVLPVNVGEVIGGFLGKRQIESHVFSAIMKESGLLRKKSNLTGRATVSFYPDTQPYFYLKAYPESAVDEYAATTLMRAFGVSDIPYSDLLACPHAQERLYPVLLTQAVQGEPLYKIWNDSDGLKTLDPHHTGLLILVHMLLNPEDGKEDNLILTPDRKRLIPIDNDHAFFPGALRTITKQEKRGWFGFMSSTNIEIHEQLQPKSILFCLDEMQRPIPDSVTKHVLSLDMDCLLTEWMKGVRHVTESYQSLFPIEVINNLLREDKSVLSFTAQEEFISTLYFKAHLMQRLLIQTPQMTPLQLLSQLEPYVGKKYSMAFNSGKTVKERFLNATKGLYANSDVKDVYISRINSHQMMQIKKIDPQNLTGGAGGNEFETIENLLERLKEDRIKSEKNISSALKGRGFLGSPLNCASLSQNDQKKEFEKLISHQETVAMINNSLHLDWFSEILFRERGPFLRALDLRAAGQLDGKALPIMAIYCPNLEYLNLSGWKKLRSVDVSDPLSFPLLMRLNINDCPQLNKIRLSLTSLMLLEAQNNKYLEEINLQLPSLRYFDFRGSNLPQNWKVQSHPDVRIFGLWDGGNLASLRWGAENNSQDAQFKLAILYHFGYGVRKNLDEAVYWYLKLSEKDHLDAQFSLGIIHSQKGSFKEAFPWYLKVAKRGHASAQFSVALMFMEGVGKPKNEKKGRKWCLKAAKTGHPLALEKIYLLEKVPSRKQKSFIRLLDETANKRYREEKDDGETLFLLGWLHYCGYHGEQNEGLAYEYFEKATLKGDTDAQCYLAWMLKKGISVPKDGAKAKDLFEKAAKQGNPHAQYMMGRYHLKERSQDPHALGIAAYWFKRSVAQDHALAEYKLGLMYLCDELESNTEKYAKKAFLLFKKAAAQNLAKAQFRIIHAYDLAYDLQSCITREETIQFFKNAAQQDYIPALHAIGDLHNGKSSFTSNEFCKDFPKDYLKAQEYYGQAAILGSHYGLSCYNEITCKINYLCYEKEFDRPRYSSTESGHSSFFDEDEQESYPFYEFRNRRSFFEHIEDEDPSFFNKKGKENSFFDEDSSEEEDPFHYFFKKTSPEKYKKMNKEKLFHKLMTEKTVKPKKKGLSAQNINKLLEDKDFVKNLLNDYELEKRRSKFEKMDELLKDKDLRKLLDNKEKLKDFEKLSFETLREDLLEFEETSNFESNYLFNPYSFKDDLSFSEDFNFSSSGFDKEY